jgi:SAM-dependent methyltransferase
MTEFAVLPVEIRLQGNMFCGSTKLVRPLAENWDTYALRMAGSISWLDQYKDTVKRALDFLGLGIAVRDLRNRGGYLLDAETRHRNARFKTNFAVDGLPMPPPELVYLVTGQFDVEAFYQNGVVGATWIEEMIGRQGLEMNEFDTILDFGCGCGRVMRQWKKLQGAKLYGIDYNPRLVKWCSSNLPFAEFGVNKSRIPLTFADETFDFIYSISVFTHLTESNQRFWTDELRRVLRPGIDDNGKSGTTNRFCQNPVLRTTLTALYRVRYLGCEERLGVTSLPTLVGRVRHERAAASQRIYVSP